MPRLCLDETSKQLRPVLYAAYDHEYQRNGVTCTLFAPLEGWRRVEVTDRRTRIIGPGWSCSASSW